MDRDTKRLERLEKALAVLTEMKGSPDLIAAILTAIQEETRKK